jgi:hypothetical protein
VDATTWTTWLATTTYDDDDDIDGAYDGDDDQVDAVDSHGATALHYAAHAGTIVTVAALLEAPGGRKALHVANHRHQQTPLHSAAVRGHAEARRGVARGAWARHTQHTHRWGVACGAWARDTQHNTHTDSRMGDCPARTTTTSHENASEAHAWLANG